MFSAQDVAKKPHRKKEDEITELKNKVEKLLKSSALLERHNLETRNSLISVEKKLESHTDYLNTIAPKDAQSTMELFKNEIKEMHDILRVNITKLCTMTEIYGLAKHSNKHMLAKITDKLIRSLDWSDTWWKECDRLTCGQILAYFVQLVEQDEAQH